MGERFKLCVVGEDRWGNPSDQLAGDLQLAPSSPIAGLPHRARMVGGRFSLEIDDLAATAPCDLVVSVRDGENRQLCQSNSLRIVAKRDLGHYWADLHSQSEETIGTNSARSMFEFARDRAFLDAASHQGNDFQVTSPFWQHLNELTREFNEDGRFVVFPGYEWSGNTGLEIGRAHV